MKNQTRLAPLIESFGGPHLSCYIANADDPLTLRSRILESMTTARSFLAPVLSPFEQKKFIQPFEKLADDMDLLESLTGNVALFRSQNLFRILKLPIAPGDLSVVATTFHVKPLLRWTQHERDFLFLGVQNDRAELYRGTMTSLSLVSSMEIGEPLRDRAQIPSEEWERFSTFFAESNNAIRPKLFVAGESVRTKFIYENLGYSYDEIARLDEEYKVGEEGRFVAKIRRLLEGETDKELRRTLVEYTWAEGQKRTYSNIFQIARAAVHGRIEKLIVADGVHVFGKMCRQSGDLTIHLTGIDHEDDDVLDDIAQEVVLRGGEVIVAPREDLPRRRLALAILNQSEFPKELLLDRPTGTFFEKPAV